MEAEMQKGEVILYHPSETIKLEVRLEKETVWLTQQQIADLFGKERSGITKHINNIFAEKELEEKSNVSFFHIANSDKPVKYFSLDVIISVGYRVKSVKGTQFRIWANKVIKEYLLRGYSVNPQLLSFQNQLDSRLELQNIRIQKIEEIQLHQQEQIDLYIKTNEPNKEQLFGNGCVFDAWSYISDLVRSAKSQIELIDNYVDDRVLMILSKRTAGVKAIIHTRYTDKFITDLEKYNKQFAEAKIDFIQLAHKNHDRFLIIDDDVYMLGNSVKDFGNAWGAVIKMEMNKKEILAMLEKE